MSLNNNYCSGEDDLTQTCEQTKEPDDVTIGFIVGEDRLLNPWYASVRYVGMSAGPIIKGKSPLDLILL